MHSETMNTSQGITGLFARASRLDKIPEGYLTAEEQDKFYAKRCMDGAKIFKRKVLGFFGRETVKSLDEIAELLVRINVANSLNEGREAVSTLVGIDVIYAKTSPMSIINDDGHICLRFSEVTAPNGDKKYKIRKVIYVPVDS
jgi:hypothetical protein